MAGIISSAMGGQEDSNYEKLAAGALRILRNEETLNSINEAIDSEDPVKALASIAYGVVVGIGDRAGGIDEQEIFPLAGEVLGYIAEAAGKMGRPLNSAELGQTFFEMLAQYSLEQGVSAQEVEQMRGSMDFEQVGAQIDASSQEGGAPESAPAEQEDDENPQEEMQPEEEDDGR